MNDELKSVTAEVADTLKAVSEIESKAADASRERDTLLAELESLDAAVDAAEAEHAEALAAAIRLDDERQPKPRNGFVGDDG